MLKWLVVFLLWTLASHGADHGPNVTDDQIRAEVAEDALVCKPKQVKRPDGSTPKLKVHIYEPKEDGEFIQELEKKAKQGEFTWVSPNQFFEAGDRKQVLGYTDDLLDSFQRTFVDDFYLAQTADALTKLDPKNPEYQAQRHSAERLKAKFFEDLAHSPLPMKLKAHLKDLQLEGNAATLRDFIVKELVGTNKLKAVEAINIFKKTEPFEDNDAFAQLTAASLRYFTTVKHPTQKRLPDSLKTALTEYQKDPKNTEKALGLNTELVYFTHRTIAQNVGSHFCKAATRGDDLVWSVAYPDHVEGRATPIQRVLAMAQAAGFETELVKVPEPEVQILP